MKTAQAIVEILKREGVEFVIGYPVNPILEFAARADVRPDHRAPGAHRPAHGRRGVAGHQRPAHRRLRHAARPRLRERLRRRGAGVGRLGAHRRAADGLSEKDHQHPAQLQLDAQLSPRHQVGRAGARRRRGGERDEARVHPGAQRPAGAGAGRGADGRLRRGRGGAARVPARRRGTAARPTRRR